MYLQKGLSKVFIIIALYLGLIILLCGCSRTSAVKTTDETKANDLLLANNQSSISSDIASSTGDNQYGYIMANSTKTALNAAFIQWTEVDGQLTGQVQWYSINANSLQPENSSNPFKGLHNNENISFEFTANPLFSPFGGQIWTGTLKNDELVLVIPSDDGKLNSIAFHKGSVDDFNQLVNNLQTASSAMQTERDVKAMNAKQQEDRQNTINAANKAVKSGIQNISNCIDYHFENSTNFDGIIKNYNDNLNTIKTDDKKMRNNANVTPFDGIQYATVMSDYAGVLADGAAFQATDSEMRSRIDWLNQSIETLRRYIAGLQEDFNKLNTLDSNSANEYRDSVNKSIDNAQQLIKDTENAIQQAQLQATKFNQDVNQLLKDAEIFVSGLKVN